MGVLRSYDVLETLEIARIARARRSTMSHVRRTLHREIRALQMEYAFTKRDKRDELQHRITEVKALIIQFGGRA